MYYCEQSELLIYKGHNFYSILFFCPAVFRWPEENADITRKIIIIIIIKIIIMIIIIIIIMIIIIIIIII